MLTFADDACYEDFLTWLTFFEQKILKILKTGYKGLGKSELPWKRH